MTRPLASLDKAIALAAWIECRHRTAAANQARRVLGVPISGTLQVVACADHGLACEACIDVAVNGRHQLRLVILEDVTEVEA